MSLQGAQPVTPIVELPEPTGQEVGVADVLIGSFGLVGALTVLALIVGLIAGGGFILWRRWREAKRDERQDEDHVRLRLSGPAPTARP
ncbi:MAG TPA: hypothetical protein VIL35_02930 [Vicinamibacterales bacterium]